MAVIFETLGLLVRDAVYFLWLLVTGGSEECYTGIFWIKG